MSDWKDVDTDPPPKDGTPFLMLVPERIVVGGYDQANDRYAAISTPVEFKLWMPLPSPPDKRADQ